MIEVELFLLHNKLCLYHFSVILLTVPDVLVSSNKAWEINSPLVLKELK